MKKKYLPPQISIEALVLIEEFTVGSLSANIYVGDDLEEYLLEVETTIDNSSFGNAEISL